LWVFLVSTLVSPAMAAVAIFLASLAAGTFGFGPPSLQGLTGGVLAAAAGERAISAYLWSAAPSALAGGGMATLVLIRGTFGWLAAAVAGVVAFAATAVAAGGQLANHLTPLALLAGIIAVVTRLLLVRGRIING
jgi:hypothetical protein